MPFPYVPTTDQTKNSDPTSLPRSFAESWVEQEYTSHQSTLSSFVRVLPSQPQPHQPILAPFPPDADKGKIHSMPFKSLRDTTKNRVVGDINLVPRASQPHTDEVAERGWVFGYVLDPVYHGRGIMSEMVACVLEGWVKPWMGISTVGAVSPSPAQDIYNRS